MTPEEREEVRARSEPAVCVKCWDRYHRAELDDEWVCVKCNMADAIDAKDKQIAMLREAIEDIDICSDDAEKHAIAAAALKETQP